jgi:hypothetical protein
MGKARGVNLLSVCQFEQPTLAERRFQKLKRHPQMAVINQGATEEYLSSTLAHPSLLLGAFCPHQSLAIGQREK